MPRRRIGRMSCLTQTLMACGCLLRNEPGRGCRHTGHIIPPRLQFCIREVLRLFAGGSDPTPLQSEPRADYGPVIAQPRRLRREACDIWLPWRRRSPLGSEWPRLRHLAIKYEPSCQFFFEQRFSLLCTTSVSPPIFLKRHRGYRRPALVTGYPFSSNR